MFADGYDDGRKVQKRKRKKMTKHLERESWWPNFQLKFRLDARSKVMAQSDFEFS